MVGQICLAAGIYKGINEACFGAYNCAFHEGKAKIC